MYKTIVLPFDMDKLKIVTQIRVKPEGRVNPTPFDAYLDMGSTDTVMSAHLFEMLGFKEQHRLKVSIAGITEYED